MFWLPQEAPEWLTFPLRQAAAITAQAAAKAAEEARKADALALAKIQADLALAQTEQDAANALAEQLSKEPEALRIDRAYELTLSRLPTAKERERANAFLQSSPFAELCRALINTNEFIYLD